MSVGFSEADRSVASNLEFQGHSGDGSVTSPLQGHSSDASTTSMLKRRSGERLGAASLRKSLRHAEQSGVSLIESSRSLRSGSPPPTLEFHLV
jgi:hypothetical protein